MWKIIRMSGIYRDEILGGENGGEAIFEDLVANNFPELRKPRSTDFFKKQDKWEEIHIQTHLK